MCFRIFTLFVLFGLHSFEAHLRIVDFDTPIVSERFFTANITLTLMLVIKKKQSHLALPSSFPLFHLNKPLEQMILHHRIEKRGLTLRYRYRV